MLSARSLTQRLRRLAPEAMTFATIGAVNTMLYFAITWVALPIGAVKASVLATVITTTLAYFANRYWTYRHHKRSALRREYTLFFGFNLVGMIIQSGAVTIGKYGLGLTEEHDKLLILGCIAAGVAVGTLFRFWAYRTFVFLKPQQLDADAEAELTALDPAAGLAELSTESGTESGTESDTELRTGGGTDLDSEIAAEIAADRRHANR